MKKMASKGLIGVAALCGYVAASIPAVAQQFTSVSAPSFIEVLQDNDVFKTSVLAGAISSNNVYVQATYSSGHDLESVSITPQNSTIERGLASVSYQFVVIAGPKQDPNKTVPIELSGKFVYRITDPGVPDGTDAVSYSVSSSALSGAYTGTYNYGNITENIFNTVQVKPFQIYTVTDNVSASADADSNSTATNVFAILDPTVNFADGFDSNGYTLVVSPSPVPELPSAWMMLAGFGVLGVFFRSCNGPSTTPPLRSDATLPATRIIV